MVQKIKPIPIKTLSGPIYDLSTGLYIYPNPDNKSYPLNNPDGSEGVIVRSHPKNNVNKAALAVAASRGKGNPAVTGAILATPLIYNGIKNTLEQINSGEQSYNGRLVTPRTISDFDMYRILSESNDDPYGDPIEKRDESTVDGSSATPSGGETPKNNNGKKPKDKGSNDEGGNEEKNKGGWIKNLFKRNKNSNNTSSNNTNTTNKKGFIKKAGKIYGTALPSSLAIDAIGNGLINDVNFDNWKYPLFKFTTFPLRGIYKGTLYLYGPEDSTKVLNTSIQNTLQTPVLQTPVVNQDTVPVTNDDLNLVLEMFKK